MEKPNFEFGIHVATQDCFGHNYDVTDSQLSNALNKFENESGVKSVLKSGMLNWPNNNCFKVSAPEEIANVQASRIPGNTKRYTSWG